MTKILVLGERPFPLTHADTAYYSDYAAYVARATAAADLACQVSYAFVGDLVISVGEGRFEIMNSRDNASLDTYAAILLRGDQFRTIMDVLATISIYAQSHAIPVINSYASVRDSSKLLQAALLEHVGLPVAQTWYVNDALLHSRLESTELSFPAILKAVHGSHGNSNYLVGSMDEVRSVVAQAPETRFVLQRFVPNDGDYRIVIAGTHTLVIKRIASGDSHLNNTSQGGRAELVDAATLPEKLVSDARVVSGTLGMTVAGVDAIIDKTTGDYFFLEANAQPQLMSGAFVTEKEMLIGRMLADIIKP